MRELLPQEQLAQFDSLLESGNGLPFSADLAATPELAGNPALVQWMMQLIEGGVAGQAVATASDPGRAAISMADFRSMLLSQGSPGEGGNGSRPAPGSDNMKLDAQSAILLSQDEGVAELPQQIRALLLKGDAPGGLLPSQSIPGSTPFSSLMAGVEAMSSPRGMQVTPAPLNMPMGERGWDNVLGNRIMWMVGKEMQQASLQIAPRHLGPIDIQVTVQNDLTNVTFTAQHAVTREAIEAAIPRLREMFMENNMQLVNVDVGQRDGAASNGSSDLAGQGAGRGGPGGTAGGETGEDAQDPTLQQVRTGSGLVDDYA
ncbi:MAG: flagellar hook-length control protein FliK [Sedimenticola sp.]|nr:flagellar hook-length control protein FliK [Sedimenticola sp.]